MKGVRDAAAVESAHREGVREAVRAAVRRLLVASDCALTRDWTLISDCTRYNKKRRSEGTTLASIDWSLIQDHGGPRNFLEEGSDWSIKSLKMLLSPDNARHQ